MAKGYINNNKPNFHEHPNFGKGKHRLNPDAVNHDFRKKLWEGKIPVKVSLYYKECTHKNSNIRSMYLLAPRTNYMVYILGKVKSYFDDFVDPENIKNYDDMWFEYNGKPLNWVIPVGVLFDTLVGDDSYQQSKSSKLPWELVFHYRNCPDELTKLENNSSFYVGIDNMKFSYINSIKESAVLRLGSANEILAQMKKSEEDKLLEGLSKHSYETFW